MQLSPLLPIAGEYHPPPRKTPPAPVLPRSALLESLLNLAKPTAVPSTTSYLVPSFDAAQTTSSHSNPVEELSWSGNKVVWTRAQNIYRTFSFHDQDQLVVQALFAWFPVPSDTAHLPSDSTTPFRQESTTFGPFQRSPPPAWSDDPLPLPTDPQPSTPSQPTKLQRHLIIFLSDLAFVYPSHGKSFALQLPFHLRRAWTMDVGILLQRAEGGTESSSAVDKVATLYSLLDPAAEIKVVSYTPSLTALFPTSTVPIPRPAVQLPTNPFQDLHERIIFTSDRRDGSEPIFVCVNQESGKVSVWAYARVDTEEQSSSGEILKGALDVKGKGRASIVGDDSQNMESNTTSRLGRTASLPSAAGLKRKRPSFANNGFGSTSLGDRDRSQRRTSTVGSTSAAIGGIGNTSGILNAGEEVDLLEVLGETMLMGPAMKRTASAISAMSAAERRGSVTRNELSITLDRMALGAGAMGGLLGVAAHDMDREATLFVTEGEESRMVSDVIVEKIYEMDLGNGGTTSFDGISASLFDSRCATTSNLSIFLPQSSTLLILTMCRIEGGRISVVPLLQTSAVAATPVLATRPHVLDLLFVSPDGKWAVINAGGKIESVEGPTLPSGKRIEKLSGDGSREVVVTLDDSKRFVTTVPDTPTGLAMDCLHVLSLVLPLETFFSLQSAISSWKRTVAGSSDFGAIAAVLGGDQAMDSTPPEHIPESDAIFANLRSSPTPPTPASTPHQQVVSIISPAEIDAAFLALHLLSEDYRLFTDTISEYQELAGLLLDLATSMGLYRWVDEYRRATGRPLKAPLSSPTTASTLPSLPINFSTLLADCLDPKDLSQPLYRIDQIAKRFDLTPSFFYGQLSVLHRTRNLFSAYARLSIPETGIESPSVRAQNAVLRMYKGGWGREELEKVVFGVALPIWEAVRLCQLEAPENWPEGAYKIIRRDDLARQVGGKFAKGDGKRANFASGSTPIKLSDICLGKSRDVEDQAEARTRRSRATRFGEDRRLEEVDRMLQYSSPVTINGGDRSLEQLTPAVQQGILLSLSNRTLSLPVGFAMYTFRSSLATPTETVPISTINLSARILPMPSIVSLSEKDRGETAGPMKEKDRIEWPEFHSGVAAALQLGGGGHTGGFDSSQILFNKPGELNSRHAGFLMGLGLMGQISTMMFNQAFEYLKMKHDPTSIGLLLGLSVNYLGTADEKVAALLSVHLTALHPPNSSPLNVSGMTQAAGLVGIGLLYLGTKKRTLAEIMIRELCGIKVISIEDATACREAYALSAGFSFGLIMLGKGNEPTPTGGGETGLLKTFRDLILGENDRPLPGSTPSSHLIDVNITSPAATMALALMYLKTEKKEVAALLEIPSNARRLDYVRSDLLLLRTLGRCLIMWETVASSKEWVESHLPKFIVDGLAGGKVDPELDIARWNQIAGACFGMGLKFAGTARKEAHVTLIHYLDRLTRAAYVKASTVQGKIKRHAIRCCLSVVAISLAMVMAGTGELNVLRRLRIAHGHFSEGVTYGTHLSSHMALGLLFLGAGKYTLGTSDSAIAALVIAFYPALPSTPMENRAHLQAYRHLWTIAIEPRCLVARDVDTDELSFLPVRLRLKDAGTTTRALELVAPTLIPELRLIDTIQIDSPRYWSFSLHLSANSSHLTRFLHDGTLFVKRRTGHLSYSQDPRGNKSIFTRSKSETGSSVFDLGEISRMLAPSESNLKDFINSFSDDGESVSSVGFLCPSMVLGGIGGPSEWEAFSASVLLECLTKDKPDSISIYRAIHHAHSLLSPLSPSTPSTPSRPLSRQAIGGLEQLNLVLAFYKTGLYEKIFKNPKSKSSVAREPLIQRPFIDHIARKLALLGTTTDDETISKYVLDNSWPTDPASSDRLSTYLLLHRVPSIGVLKELKGVISSTKVDSADSGTMNPSDTMNEREMEEWKGRIRLILAGMRRRFREEGEMDWSTEFEEVLIDVC